MLFGLTLFVAAFLLFSVQPLIGKLLLPWFGGTPAVWSTCLVFFQVALLAGYLHAHRLAARPAQRQAWFQLGLLLATAGLLGWQAATWGAPLLPDASWLPVDSAEPTWRVLALLATAVGAPFVALAATSPLLQRWYHDTYPDRSPYPLYATSNAGSLLGLLGYPLLIEPWVSLSGQAWMWSGGFVVCVVGIAWCGVVTRGAKFVPAPPLQPAQQRGAVWQWIGLALWPSALLLATTSMVCDEIAPVPLLWVVPLGLYLLSMILCFGHARWRKRSVWTAALAVAVVVACAVLFGRDRYIDIVWEVGLLCAILFVVCMACHSELVRARPEARNLTGFYLASTAGGALGGLLVGLVAPAVTSDFYEYHVALLGSLLVVLWAQARDSESGLRRGQPGFVLVCVGLGPWAFAALFPSQIQAWLGHRPPGAVYHGAALFAGGMLLGLARLASRSWHRRRRVSQVCWGLLVIGLSWALHDHLQQHQIDVVETTRNFYGVLRVRVSLPESPDATFHTLKHGAVSHGMQYQSPRYRDLPTTYYGRSSGVGLCLQAHPARATGDRSLRVGAIGLGVGTIAAYGRRGDAFRFYEINPEVIRLARDAGYFSYLSRSQAALTYVGGDGRLALVRELEGPRTRGFDVLVVDAFNGGSVPVHLLTTEAADVYRGHLAPGGVLAFHVTSAHLDLQRVVRGLAAHLGLEAVVIYHPGDTGALRLELASVWVLVTDNARLLAAPPIASHVRRPKGGTPVRWTDKHGSVAALLFGQR